MGRVNSSGLKSHLFKLLFKYSVVKIILCFSLVNIFMCEKVEFVTFPRTSPEFPLTRRTLFIQTLGKNYPSNHNIYVERMTSDNSTTALVQESNSRMLSSRHTYFTLWGTASGSNSSANGPKFIRVTVYSEDGETPISEPSDIQPVYYDFSISNINLDFEATKGRPGEIFIRLVGKTPEDQQKLDESARVFSFYAIDPITRAGDSTVGVCERNRVSDRDYLHWVFFKPRIIYWKVVARSSAYYCSSIYSYSTEEVVFATRVCSDSGSCPSVEPGWAVFDADPIQGDIQFPFLKSSIGLMEGVALYLTLGTRRLYDWAVPDTIDLDLPSGIVPYDRFPTGYQFFTSVSRQSEHGAEFEGFTLNQWGGGWRMPEGSEATLAFNFTQKVIFGMQYSMYLRFMPGGAWQEIKITPKKPERITTLPKEVVTSFTFSEIVSYESVDLYKDLGFNAIPKQGSIAPVATFNSNWEKFYPENRDPKMKFCVVANPFVTRTAEEEMLFSYHTMLTLSAVDETKLPDSLSGAARTEELRIWQNALSYRAQHGDIDIAYLGHFYETSLSTTEEFTRKLQPDVLAFDVENFNWKQYMLDDLTADSTNFKEWWDQENESAEEAYDRLVDKILSDIRDHISRACAKTMIVWYGVRCDSNAGYTFGKFNHYQDQGNVVCQPELYTCQRHPVLSADSMRASKQGCCYNGVYKQKSVAYRHVMPMITHGCYGETNASTTRDTFIQIFTNGGTGYFVYSQKWIDDHDYFVYTNEIMRKLIGPYERFIMNGQVVFWKFSYVHNVVVGALQHGTDYILGLSPNWNSAPGKIKFPLDGRSSCKVTDVLNGGVVKLGEDNDPKIEIVEGELVISFESEVRSSIYLVEIGGSGVSAVGVVLGLLFGVFLPIVLMLLVCIGIVIIVVVVVKRRHENKNGKFELE